MDGKQYMSLPYDLSGAMSKNRFRNEMLWGLSLIFDSYIAQKDFVAIFDYVCDVELHSDGEFAFYQLKTSSGTTPYSTKKLTTYKKDSEEAHSIIGKLFLIKNALSPQATNHKVAIVSNVPIRLNNKTYTNFPEVCIGSVEQEVIDGFTLCLQEEFPDIKKFDFTSVYYILSTIDLFNPHDTLLGRTVTFYQQVTGSEPTKPKTLYRAFSDAISNCACYEMEIHTYNELVAYKGITSSQVENIINQYSDNANDSVAKCKEYIENLYCDDFVACLKTKRALEQIVIDLQRDKILQRKEQEIQSWILENSGLLKGSKAEVADFLIERCQFSFPIEYNRIQMWTMYLLIFIRMEEGVYEKLNH